MYHYVSSNMEKSYENEIGDIMQPQFKGQMFTDKFNLRFFFFFLQTKMLDTGNAFIKQ